MGLWSGVNDDVTRSLIAVITIVAAVLIVVGWVRASRARRRFQLVIPDMDGAPLDPAVFAGLSSLLRQQVRRVLNSPGAPDSASLAATVGEDIAGGVVALHSRVEDIPRLEFDVMAAPRDEVGMLAGGIRAVSPERADGLLGALSAALPAQRGSITRPKPQTREWGGLRQVGLTLDAGPIHRAHQASATFWSSGTPSTTGGNTQNDRDELVDLLRPAAIWIAIYLAGGSLPVHRSNRLWFVKPSHGKDLGDEIDALRAILTGQLASYEMSWYMDRPLIALGFSDQALYDANRAMRILDGYFRPHYLAGTIHELRGDALIALKDLVSRTDHAAEASTADSYASQAVKAFDQARKEFDQALKLLDQTESAATIRAHELHTDFRVRSLKAALRGSDPNRALDEVLKEKVDWTTMDQHYNVACLYAVASGVARNLNSHRFPRHHPKWQDGHELAKQSRGHLVTLIKQDPALAMYAETDPDLRMAFTLEELHRITQDAGLQH